MKTFKFTKVLLIVFCFMGQAAAWSQIQKSLIGFQDIPWGTNLKQVKSKFKNLKLIDQCSSDDEIKSILEKTDRGCEILTSDYIVDGTVFDQTFIFDLSGGLRRIELLHSKSSHKISSYSDDLCNQLFNRMEYLLDSRYGPSVGVSNTEPLPLWGRSEYKAWLPWPTEIFIAKSFDSQSPITKRNPDLKGCQVYISYSPRVSSQAKKL